MIEKFSIASDSNAVDANANLLAASQATGCVESETYGYVCGGTPVQNTVQKFSFASVANATDVGDMTVTRYHVAGCSSGTHGYCAGGAQVGTTYYNVIDKFSTSSDGNSTDVGNLLAAATTCDSVHY
jgi:hypothetical protein